MRSWFNFDGSVPPGTKIHKWDKCAPLCRLQLSQLAYDDGWVVICLLCGDSYPRSTKWQSCYLQSVCVCQKIKFSSRVFGVMIGTRVCSVICQLSICRPVADGFWRGNKTLFDFRLWGRPISKSITNRKLRYIYVNSRGWNDHVCFRFNDYFPIIWHRNFFAIVW